MINKEMLNKETWLAQIQELFRSEQPTEESKFLSAVELIIFSKHSDNLSLYYKEFGLDNFLKFCSYFSNSSIKVPDYQEIKDSIMVALCYYFKEIKQYSWEEIINIFPEREINQIKYGKKISKLKSHITKELFELLRGIDIEDTESLKKMYKGDNNE